MSDVHVREAPTTTATGPNPTGDFIWYELMTPDPAGSKAFYDAVVGWDIEPQPAGAMDYRMIRRSDGGNAGGIMRITDEMASHGARPVWLGYLNVDNVDASVDSIERAGGKALMPAFDIPDIGRIAMVADAQGAPFYIMKPIPPAGRENEKSDVFSPSENQRVGWNELSTTDPAGARRFYGEQFGWDSSDFMDMGEMGEYRFLDHHGTRIGALCGVMPGGQPKWRFYFRVPSIEAAKQTAEDSGGTIHMGPHQVPTGDWIVIGSDPNGAEFALVGGE
jgi:predicted enzyme related to lactoylglutathione lyase